MAPHDPADAPWAPPTAPYEAPPLAAVDSPGAVRRTRWAAGLATAASLLAPALQLLSVPSYAERFGWVAAIFLLPFPVFAGLGFLGWARASRAGMRDAERPWWLRALLAGLRGAVLGALVGFFVAFFMGLATWFMTPASSFGLELYLDALQALAVAIIGGFIGLLASPLVGRAPPDAPAREG